MCNKGAKLEACVSCFLRLDRFLAIYWQTQSEAVKQMKWEMVVDDSPRLSLQYFADLTTMERCQSKVFKRLAYNLCSFTNLSKIIQEVLLEDTSSVVNFVITARGITAHGQSLLAQEYPVSELESQKLEGPQELEPEVDQSTDDDD